MSPARRPSSRRRRPKKATPTAAALWRPVPQLPEPEPIVRADDPAAVLRSLGDPPLQGQGAVAEHYLAAVVERSAYVATALAAAAGLLAEHDEEGRDA
ncbi:MAG: hypothetical protein M3N11_01120 [Actinomycetota bacterium]|nr:hypothetical protein [Actinomycetota bacterium]